MPPSKTTNEKKNTLLALKEKILQNIKYYEKRIEEFRAKASSKVYFESSSDSEDDFPITIDNNPSLPQLKIEQAMLQTCLQATQELTSLQVLQSEVNLMVEDPVMEGEPPVKEPGSWREVTAECRIDLVPFSIMFHVHEPNRLFPPQSYRNLKVLPVKTAHEAELSKSILKGVLRPSDAVEVLRSYAAAYRSRRTTLSKLADKYAQNLYMEPMAEGGYLLKCANLLEMSWRLENKSSPLAAFHHRMKFDLEYMDESYIKIITQAHQQLADPTIKTDERTLLLAKIISTCLEAQGPTQELYESMESDSESVKRLEKRRTTLDQETEGPVTKKKRDGIIKPDVNDKDREMVNDDEIMAPPKSLPKKVKPKGKENADQNRKSVKRSNVDEVTSSVKKAKTGTNEMMQMVSELDAARRVEKEAKNREDKAKSNDRNQNETDTARNKASTTQSKANTAQSEANTDKAVTKVSVSQNNTENEPAKDTEKVKNMKKYKNNVAVDQEKTNNIGIEKNTNIKEKTGNANEEQEKSKKKTTEITKSHKVPTKDKLVAGTKNDPKIKDSEVELQMPISNNNIASSENVPKNSENVTNKKTVKSKSAATKKPPTDNIQKDEPNVVQKDKPETSKNTNKKFTIDNKNEKTKNQNVKSTKNVDKPQNDAKSANTNKKFSVNNKESNLHNAKTAVINKDSNKKTKTSDTKIATNKDKNIPKSSASKPVVANAINLANEKNNEQNTERGPHDKDLRKNNIQKAKVDTNNAKENKITTNKAKNSPKNINIEKHINQINTKPKEMVEKVVKVKNVAIVTKEHVGDRTDAKNAAIVKPHTIIGDGKTKNLQNKMVIKNLSHKNPSTQNKLPKNVNTNMKTGSTVKNFRTGNTDVNGSATKISKIPQKKLSPISESALKKNPLRISPRKIPSTFKSNSDSNIKKKMSLKHGTNIPRLMKKPEPKLK